MVFVISPRGALFRPKLPAFDGVVLFFGRTRVACGVSATKREGSIPNGTKSGALADSMADFPACGKQAVVAST